MIKNMIMNNEWHEEFLGCMHKTQPHSSEKRYCGVKLCPNRLFKLLILLCTTWHAYEYVTIVGFRCVDAQLQQLIF